MFDKPNRSLIPMLDIENTDCLVTTNGMFIIDKIINKVENTVDENVPGGGGLFSTVGSTIVVSSDNKEISFPKEALLSKIKFIVDCGVDFPYNAICPVLDTWNVDIKYRINKNRLTTRGLNEYTGNYRRFEYETPKLQIVASDLATLTTENKEIGIVHLVSSPKRCKEIIEGLKRNDTYLCYNYVWELTPDLCTLEHLPSVLEILEFYSVSKGFKIVVSPNSEEFLQLVEGGEVVMDPSLDVVKDAYLKHKYTYFKNLGHKFIIRCGKLGCLYPQNNDTFKHFPAYHDSSSSEKIVDATGCGNSFLGAFSAALILTDFNYSLACIFGNIASAIVLESKGLPTNASALQDENTVVLWNGLSFNQRLDYYKKKFLIP